MDNWKQYKMRMMWFLLGSVPTMLLENMICKPGHHNASFIMWCCDTCCFIKKMQLLWIRYCTWTYCNFDSILINCSAMFSGITEMDGVGVVQSYSGFSVAVHRLCNGLLSHIRSCPTTENKIKLRYLPFFMSIVLGCLMILLMSILKLFLNELYELQWFDCLGQVSPLMFPQIVDLC